MSVEFKISGILLELGKIIARTLSGEKHLALTIRKRDGQAASSQLTMSPIVLYLRRGGTNIRLPASCPSGHSGE
jgi:hypothetical protein